MKRAALGLGLWIAMVSGIASAQQLEVRASQAPYYAGVPIEFRVIAEGFDEDPRPELQFQPLEGMSLELQSVSPNVSSFMQIINGKVTQSRRVEFVYSLLASAAKPGDYVIGPFTVVQGSTKRETGRFRVQVEGVPLGEGQRVILDLPEGPVYVGQTVDVGLEWWTDTKVADRLLNQIVSVPLFERVDRFVFRDQEDPKARFSINIQSGGRILEMPATARNEREGSTVYVVRRIERKMVPLEAGSFELDAASLVVDEAIGWRRDFFGVRSPTRVRKLRVEDKARTLVVSPLPAEGRPTSFAGAVGSGFNLQASADRTVVRRGDPVKLTLVLRGDGDVENASLPSLEAAGLARKFFRAPEAATPGSFEGAAKRFEVQVRVLDQAAREIPPLEFSWFNPSLGRYESTRSDPIALSVGEASVVSADDVFNPAADTSASDEEKPAKAPATSDTSSKGFVLTGADLAIETDLGVLAAVPRSGGLGDVGRGLLYGAGLLLLGGAWMRRRSLDEDPKLRSRREEVDAAVRKLKAASAASDLADALRLLRVHAAASERGRIDTLVRGLEELVYRPGGEGAAAPSELTGEAEDIASQIRGAVRRGTLAVALACALLVGAAPTHAQTADVESSLHAAIQAYDQAQQSADRGRRLAGFASAQRHFQAAADAGADSAELYANLGTAALRAEDLGHAVLAFRRALARDSAQRRALHNLGHARGLLPSWVPRPSPAKGFGGMFDAFVAMPISQRNHAAAWAFLAACATGAFALLWGSAPARFACGVAALCWALLTGSAFLPNDDRGQEAVVVAAEVVARAADSLHAPARFTQPLPAGTEVRILETRERWVRVAVANGRDAWVPGSAVRTVAAGD